MVQLISWGYNGWLRVWTAQGMRETVLCRYALLDEKGMFVEWLSDTLPIWPSQQFDLRV